MGLIKELALLVREVVGFDGEIRFDLKSPDGTPEKRLDATPLFAAGWRPTAEIKEALRESYDGYLRGRGVLQYAPTHENMSHE